MLSPGYSVISVYDPYVYYTAPVAVDFGFLPYRDFTFLHPPGVIVAMMPFAWIGGLAGDRQGLMTASVFIVVMTACVAALLAWMVRGLGVIPSLIAGLIPGLLHDEVTTDIQAQLEPFYNTEFIVGMAVLGAALAGVLSRRTSRPVPAIGRVRERPWLLLVSGILLGAALMTKLVIGAPLVAVLAFVVAVAGWRRALNVVAGVAVSVLAIGAPFIAQAPTTALRMMFETQVGRTVGSTALRNYWPASLVPSEVLVPGTVIITLLIVAGVVWHAFRHRPVSMFWAWLAIGVAAAGELFIAPTHFGDYDTLLTAPIAIGAAFVVARFMRPGRRRAILVVASAVAVAIVVGVLRVAPILPSDLAPTDPPDRFGTLDATMQPYGCVFAIPNDSVVLANRFTPQMRAGCPFVVDRVGVSLAQSVGIDTPEARHVGAKTATAALTAIGRQADAVVTNGKLAAFAKSADWTEIPGFTSPWYLYVPANP